MSEEKKKLINAIACLESVSVTHPDSEDENQFWGVCPVNNLELQIERLRAEIFIYNEELKRLIIAMSRAREDGKNN